jgi:hypothetical protein
MKGGDSFGSTQKAIQFGKSKQLRLFFDSHHNGRRRPAIIDSYELIIFERSLDFRR